jgi:hypothetical protein
MTDIAAATLEPIALRAGSIAIGGNFAAAAGDARWKGLFKIAGIGAILTGILIPLQVVAFIVWPPPTGGVLEWFELFRESPIIGLVSFDLVILLEEILLIPIVLGLYLLLRPGSESLMLIAAAAWFVSIALFVGSNTGFEMMALSASYAEASSGAERATILAAGQAMLTGYMEMGSSFVVGYVLASIAGILVGISMLRNRIFPRLAAWAVIVANLLGLALFVPGIGVMLSIVSVVILIAWYLLVGWRLMRLENVATVEAT